MSQTEKHTELTEEEKQEIINLVVKGYSHLKAYKEETTSRLTSSVDENPLEEKSNDKPNSNPTQDARSVHLVDNDEKDSFSIDKGIIKDYQQLLDEAKRTPIQAIYEILAKSKWRSPIFFEIKYSLSEGYLYGLKVNEKDFVPNVCGKTKKIAKHIASIVSLQSNGFDTTNIEPLEIKLLKKQHVTSEFQPEYNIGSC